MITSVPVHTPLACRALSGPRGSVLPGIGRRGVGRPIRDVFTAAAAAPEDRLAAGPYPHGGDKREHVLRYRAPGAGDRVVGAGAARPEGQHLFTGPDRVVPALQGQRGWPGREGTPGTGCRGVAQGHRLRRLSPDHAADQHLAARPYAHQGAERGSGRRRRQQPPGTGLGWRRGRGRCRGTCSRGARRGCGRGRAGRRSGRGRAGRRLSGAAPCQDRDRADRGGKKESPSARRQLMRAHRWSLLFMMRTSPGRGHHQ